MATRRSPVLVTLAFDPEDMARRGRIGAHVTHSRHDSRELTARAREAFLAKLETEVDPDGVLSPEERRRRAEHARKAHLARASLAAARSRHKTQHPNAPETVTDEVVHVPA